MRPPLPGREASAYSARMRSDEIDAVVVGAGQAGLAVSHELTALGIEHVILERSDAVGGTWASRWDSFCLVTPNRTIALPGGEYAGDNPDGYLQRDEIVDHLGDYAASFGAPVRTGVEVTSLRADSDGRLRLTTAGGGVLVAREVIVASGGLGDEFRPAWASEVREVPVVGALAYRNPGSLPDGGVLVAGSGQTGCQLAEELAAAGRRVVLACGRAPWIPRRIEGRDTFLWLRDAGFFGQSLGDVPAGPAARLMANPQATGRDGGHDLSARTLRAMGVELAGRVTGVDGGTLVFGGDLGASVAFGDARWADLRGVIRRSQDARGLPVPDLPDAAPFDPCGEITRLPLAEIGSVLLTAGFRPSYASWVDVPDALDPMGFPVQTEGRSTVVAGLSFVGVPFMRTRASQLLMGVGADASIVARGVRERLGGSG